MLSEKAKKDLQFGVKNNIDTILLSYSLTHLESSFRVIIEISKYRPRAACSKVLKYASMSLYKQSCASRFLEDQPMNKRKPSCSGISLGDNQEGPFT